VKAASQAERKGLSATFIRLISHVYIKNVADSCFNDLTNDIFKHI
jgi:hypothetical protein